MRIGLVVNRFDPARGGLEQWAAQFATRMSTRGNEVHVISRAFGHIVEQMPIVTHQLPSDGSRLGFAQVAVEKIREVAPDIVHDTGAGILCDVFQPHGGSRLAAIEQNHYLVPRLFRPIRRMAEKVLPRYRQFRELCRRQYVNDGRIFLALSRRVAYDFQRLHGVPRDRIRLVYNGVDTQRFSPENRHRWREQIRDQLDVDERTVLLLIVAHNFNLKGLPTLLKAAALLRQLGRQTHLVVVGGKHLNPARRAARLHGVAETVSFVGSVDDTAPYYAAADIYVQPTLYDPCSLVALEALASGLPLVTSKFNGVSELLTEGTEGYVVDNPFDPTELVTRIQALLDPALRHRMADAARRLALRHSFDRNCQEIEFVYREIVDTRRRAA